MDSFSVLHKYDFEIRLHRRDLYQTSAFCGHVFSMNLLLKKVTLGDMTENKCGYQMHIFVTSFSAHHAPVWRCFCMVQPLRQPFRPKCTNKILQMHHQNPVVPPESGIHPQNPVCTYSVRMWRAVCKTPNPVCPQMENKGIYKCFRCVYHDLRLCSSRLLVRQASVCVHHVNQYTPCPPKLYAFKSATSLLPFRPNSWHHVHFTIWLSKPQHIYIYIYMSNVRRWAHTAVEKVRLRHVILMETKWVRMI